MLLKISACLAVLCLSLPATGLADTIDQSNAQTNGGSVASFTLSQSFTPTLTGINFATFTFAGAGTVSINLRAGSGDSGLILGTSDSRTLTSSFTSYTFMFSNLIGLTPGSMYTLQAFGPSSGFSSFESQGNAYTGGQEYGSGVAQTGYDLAFQEGIATSVTPEPSSFYLLGTGLLGVAGLLRKRLA